MTRGPFVFLFAAACAAFSRGRHESPSGLELSSRPRRPFRPRPSVRSSISTASPATTSARKPVDWLSTRIDPGRAAEGAEVWEKVIRKVRGGLMPPVGMPRPEKAALTNFAASLETAIDTAAAAHPKPGRPVLHRLNRSEYGNAIRDLLALDVDVASLLPPDEEAYGFDNIADVLGVSPALMERYLSASWKVASLAVGNPKITPDQGHISGARRSLAARPHRRTAGRHPGRDADPLHVPG